MEKKTIGQIKKGQYFRLSDNENAPLWVRGEYVREDGCNKYSCYKYNDVCHERFFSGNKVVYFEG